MNTETQHTAHNGQQAPVVPHGYAGFWKRAVAAFIDGLVISFFVMIALCSIHGIDYEASTQAGKNIERIGQAIGITIYWLYFALFESSSVQATFGKMAVGIKVTGAAGNRISFGRASARHFCKISSTVLFLAGYVMAAFTEKKQGLHDIMTGCLVVNKKVYTRTQTFVVVAAAVAVVITPLLTAVLCPVMINNTLQTNMTAMGSRMWDIYITIMSANAEREPLGLGTVWPKAGKKLEEGGDIGQMRFENSSDYFSVLLDGKRMGTPDWSPYVFGCDYSKCAGAGVPAKQGAGRLTAANNAWTVIANVTGDLPNGIPLIISRNVDPASLILGEGDPREQYVRPSGKFKTPFGNRRFTMLCKGNMIIRGKFGRHGTSLATIYQGADAQELQRIRDALQKIEYLTP